MDQRLSYEQLIAGKLQSIPVPDMADAIWARVEAQLDLDMPTDNGSGSAPQSPPSGPGIISWGLFIFIVVLVSLFFFKNKTNTPNELKSSSFEQPLIKAADNPIRPPNSNGVGTKSSNINNTQTPAPGFGLPQDSAVAEPIVINQPVKVDSARVDAAPPFVASSTPKDTVVTKKKKGVTGMTDNDYKIVPKKDKQ